MKKQFTDNDDLEFTVGGNLADGTRVEAGESVPKGLDEEQMEALIKMRMIDKRKEKVAARKGVQNAQPKPEKVKSGEEFANEAPDNKSVNDAGKNERLPENTVDVDEMEVNSIPDNSELVTIKTDERE